MTELRRGRQTTIEATPEPITIDTARTAVIVVDMQNDLGTKGGMFDRAGIDIAPIQKVVTPISKVLESARHAGLKAVYLKMGFRPDLSDLGPPDSPNRAHWKVFRIGEAMAAPDGTQGRILIRDTWNTRIVDELTPEPEDIVPTRPDTAALQKLLHVCASVIWRPSLAAFLLRNSICCRRYRCS